MNTASVAPYRAASRFFVDAVAAVPVERYDAAWSDEWRVLELIAHGNRAHLLPVEYYERPVPLAGPDYVRPENIAEFARVYLGSVSPREPYASPLYADLRGLPPLLLQVGDSELLLDDSRRVHEAVLRAGGRSTLDVTEGVFHVWHMLDGFLPEARQALVRVAAFLEHA